MNDWLAKKPERGQDIRILLDRLAPSEGSVFDNTARKEMKQILSEYRSLLATN